MAKSFIEWLLSEIPKPEHRGLTKWEKAENKENKKLLDLFGKKGKK